jgi:predicted DNA-binding transcriptional regulator AlpA
MITSDLHPLAPDESRQNRENSMQKLSKLLSLLEVATILGLSPHTVRSFVRQGKLHPLRLCRRLLFDPEEIAMFIARARVARTRIADGHTDGSCPF